MYQYDEDNFFCLQKIQFRPNCAERLEEVMRQVLSAVFFQVLDRRGDEVLCITRLEISAGFWKVFKQESWALLPPIVMDEVSLVISVLAVEESMQRLYDTLNALVPDYEILASMDVSNAPNATGGIPVPDITSRQREIVQFAVRKGFFDSPKKVQAAEIAEKFGISVSAVNEHLRKVERTIMEYFFL
jgi:predicted DNA binding protein